MKHIKERQIFESDYNKMINDKNFQILVTVQVVTYMHEKYISQCLESILMQKTDFDFEIVINDDASVDNTAVIISKFENNYPNKIKAIYQKENQYSKYGFKNIRNQIHNLSVGKYIALCEGDDYWTDTLKLQKQVDFLESNPKYSICFTNVSELIENKIVNSKINLIIGKNKNYETNLSNFLNPYFFYTCSSLYRNVIDINVFDKLKYCKDIFLFSLILEYGDLYLLNQVCSVYRIHEGGNWSMKSKFKNLVENTNTFGEMAQYHKYKITLINECYLWGLIDLNYLEGVKYKFRINCFLKFVKFCFRKPKYFKLLFRDFLRL